MQKRFDYLRYYHYYLTENVNGKEKKHIFKYENNKSLYDCEKRTKNT